MQGVNDIREAFLKFYEGRGHTRVGSSPLVPQNDPTLMFTNAGMVQFKNVFTGVETRDYSRAVTAQKCVRAGGKHNDLDNVGYTARHHTFFEMLGNFSFGDYFKEEAILSAWTLITDEFGIDKTRLMVTHFHEDEEARKLWKKISGLSDDRIISIATSDNFWAMGDTGPCGPCSEIFYDHGEDIPGGPPGSPDEDGDRFVEIWNLVFMQFEQIDTDTRVDLPKPSIDTGMGLERIAALMAGSHDNYDIDLFKALIAKSVDLIGTKAEGKAKASHRVLADHLRATSFLIADGVLPSNEGRGYVLRRIMRRAMRHAHMLGAKDPVLYAMVPTLIGEMGAAYPELRRAEALVTETLRHEEGKFRDMLERGLKLLSSETNKLGKGGTLPGEVAFKLYDTYGFPLDLTEDALRADGLKVDTKGFDAAMEKQRAEARAAWSGSGGAALDAVWFDVRDSVGATDFLGYEREDGEAIVTAILKDGKSVQSAKAGDEIFFTTNQTPFYGESGGQMGDAGTFKGADVTGTISDTQKPISDMHVHIATITDGRLKVGEAIELHVDGARRAGLRANHSATHLLHEALRRTLGEHVTQKGSLVAPDRLRFDISQPKALTHAEIEVVEDAVNVRIRENTEIITRLMSTDEAIEQGAMAMFGEKYGEEVRVLSMGPEETGSKRHRYSVELCGGTHAKRTGDIGVFKIIGESAVSSGVRRIEALTGPEALAYMRAQETLLQDAAGAIKAAPAELVERVSALAKDRKALEAQVSELKKQLALGGDAAKGPEAEDIGGVKFLGDVLDGVSPKDLRSLADAALEKLGSGIVAYVAHNDGKAAVLVRVSDDLTDRHDAVSLVKAGVEAVGGQGGGGRADMAQGGGPDGASASAALDAIRAVLAG